MPQGIQISAGLIKKGKNLRDYNLKPSSQRLVSKMLPKAWRKSVINFDRFNALKAQNSELEQKVAQMPENVAHIALEMDGELKLLSLEELSKLENEGLDNAGLIEQLNP